ncbi:MAG: Rv3235 family protein [Egibacteraceae bacterium]
MSALDSMRVPTSAPATAPIGPTGRRPGGRPAERKALVGQAPPGRGRCQPESDLLAMATSFATLFLEVEAGQRPPEHLARVMAPHLWGRLAPVWVRSGPRGEVRTIHGVRDQGVYDAVAVVQRGPRIAALSLRLVHTREGWLVAEAARPEDGRLLRPPLSLDEEDHPLFSLVSDDW